MSSWVIVVGAHKGGSGKSTAAVNLAAQFAKEGNKTLLVSTDPQRTAQNWIARRKLNNEERVKKGEKPLADIQIMSQTGEYAADQILDFLPNFDVTIIDTGGFDSVELRSCLLIGHVFLSPIKPSTFDTDTLRELHQTVHYARMNNRNLVPRLFINQASANSIASSKRDLQALIDAEGFQLFDPILPTVVVNRVSHWEAAGVGQAQFETKGASSGASDMTKLYLDVNDLLEEIAAKAA